MKLFYYRITIDRQMDIRRGALCIAHRCRFTPDVITNMVASWYVNDRALARTAAARHDNYNLRLEEYLITERGFVAVIEDSAAALDVHISGLDNMVAVLERRYNDMSCR